MKIIPYFYEIFYVFSAALLVFFFLEMILPGLVLAYVDFNVLLIFWLINAILIMVLRKYD